MSYIDIVFDGPPGPLTGRFVEVEDHTGKSIAFGKWVHRPDGYWALRTDDISKFRALLDQINVLACYASEEDTDSRQQVLLEIGKLARSASDPIGAGVPPEVATSTPSSAVNQPNDGPGEHT
jgi:hypothetical protein